MAKGLELLEKLCQAFGPTSCEYEVADLICEELQGKYDEHTVDFIGDHIFRIKGKTGKKLMLSAHMDEVGLMISAIDEHGYIYFQPVGGFDVKVLCGRKLFVGDYGKEKISGLIASKAIHQQSWEERGKATPINKMYIDIGAKSKEDAEKYVSVGDYAVFDSDFIRFGDGMIKGKAVDDRLGCAVLCDIIDYIHENKITPDFDLYFCFTVREEVGRSGAVVTANRIKPDMALVLEATAVGDIAGTPAHKRVADTGKGPTVSFMDHGTAYRSEMIDFAMKLGRDNDIPCQLKRYVSGGNDAGHIHKSSGGVKTVAVSCPTRYIHSASCVFNEADYDSMYRLARQIALCPVSETPVK
ncbi:MAG: M20/M25/M40 family metallo-hydrolase [Clostridia bacterium]|nr:M20/M25/M40 family metallo-hydrolase [Clostridia bacterium]